MALIPGMLLSFSDPLLGVMPLMIIFQYNPSTITRVLTPAVRVDDEEHTAGLRAASQPATETYSLTLELDATDGLEREGAITTALGIAPRLAALEMLLQPIGSSPLASAVAGLLSGGGGATIPAKRVPLVFMAWGPGRIAPVTVDQLTITESGFDELLNPIHASAEVSLTIIRPDDAHRLDALAKAAATLYQGARELKASLSLPQTAETQ